MQAAAPYTAGQPSNMAAQGHALANAYMAQQQQIAAAMAMGVMPFTPEAMAAAGAALQQNPTNGTAGAALFTQLRYDCCDTAIRSWRPFSSSRGSKKAAHVRCRAPRGEHAAGPEVLDRQAAAAAAPAAVPLV